MFGISFVLCTYETDLLNLNISHQMHSIRVHKRHNTTSWYKKKTMHIEHCRKHKQITLNKTRKIIKPFLKYCFTNSQRTYNTIHYIGELNNKTEVWTKSIAHKSSPFRTSYETNRNGNKNVHKTNIIGTSGSQFKVYRNYWNESKKKTWKSKKKICKRRCAFLIRQKDFRLS